MDWHIITSSKGGIGKTLLTLLLLAYHLENKRKGSSLVIDLNGMNTDSAELMLYRKKIGEPTSAPLKTKIPLYHSDMDSFEIYKTYSINSKGEQIYYAVGYPLNPYGLYNPQLFADLLIMFKNEVANIQTSLKLTAPIQHILIDTNYHFCNIFNWDKDTHYMAYQAGGPLQEENITVWFLWVYRQLEKLVGSKSQSTESKVVKLTANAMEARLKNDGCHFGGKSTPFKHVFSPVALVTNRAKEGSLTGTLKGLFDAMVGQRDYTIPEFQQLAGLSRGNGVSFEDWVNQLNTAFNDLKKENEEPALLFLPTLCKAVELLTGNKQQRPGNIIPLPIYQPTLWQYTDKDRGDLVKLIREMKIYRHFSALMEK